MTADTTNALAVIPSHAEAAEAAAKFSAALCAQFVERDREVASLMLALVAEEHVLLLGPPGTAKSAITLAFAEGIGLRTFVRLMGKTTVPEEVFGPYSLLALEQDRFERQIGGYLPTAETAFLDEIFKANSAVLNGLLTALNERAYDQGTARISIPLQLCVGASNELPADDGLAAMYDRFMLRHWVAYVRDDNAFSAMLQAKPTSPPRMARGAIEVLRAAAAIVDVAPVIPAVVAIRADLAGQGIVVSDRRWRKSLGIVRAAAAIAGRTVARGRDLACLQDILWDRPEQAPAIAATVLRHRNPGLTLAQKHRAAGDARVTELVRGIPGGLASMDMGAIARASSVVAFLQECLREVRALDMADADIQAEEAAIRAAGTRIQDAIRSAHAKIRI